MAVENAIKRKKRLPPLSLRLTVEEREQLNRLAGDMPLNTFIKSVLFGVDRKPKRKSRTPVKDHAALAEVLACLGQLGLSGNLKALANAADTGTLHWDDDAPATIKQACDDIVVMRLLLMKALGFQIEKQIEQTAEQSVSQAFVRASLNDEVSS